MDNTQFMNMFDPSKILANSPKVGGEQTKYEPDPRFFKLKAEAGSSDSVVFRLLVDSKGSTYTMLYHYFNEKIVNGVKKHLIMNSPATINKKDPVADYYWELVNSGLKEEASVFKRKVKYITNIYIEKYPKDPSLEGKVFLFEFGTKLLDFFNKHMYPKSSLKEPMELYNPIKGHSVEVVLTKPIKGFPHYDESVVSPSKTALGGKDIEEIKDIILNKTYDLSEFTSEANFPSEEEAQKILDRFLGSGNAQKANSTTSLGTTRSVEAPAHNILEETPKPKASKEDELPDWSSEVVEAPKAESKKQASDDEDWLDSFDLNS